MNLTELRRAVAAAMVISVPMSLPQRINKHESRYYPEWRSRLKTRGRKDRSQRIGSNRRKAATKH